MESHARGSRSWADRELAVGSPGTQTQTPAESPGSRGQDTGRGGYWDAGCSVITGDNAQLSPGLHIAAVPGSGPVWGDGAGAL